MKTLTHYYFCATCISEGQGRAMSKAESVIHIDNFPGHALAAEDADKECDAKKDS